jgi:hypothetical protein
MVSMLESDHAVDSVGHMLALCKLVYTNKYQYIFAPGLTHTKAMKHDR